MFKGFVHFLMIVFSLLILSSCGNQKGNNQEENISSPEITHPDTAEFLDSNNISPLALNFEARVDYVNTTSEESAKFEAAVELIKKVVATKEFRDRVLNHTYNGVKTFVDNGGYSNAEIYQIILEGSEKLNKLKNNSMDMEVELFYANTNVVGYTISNTPRIWVNTKYFYSFSISSVASNLFHEWLHKLGFRHAVDYSVSRDYSVPYAVGRIVRLVGQKFLNIK